MIPPTRLRCAIEAAAAAAAAVGADGAATGGGGAGRRPVDDDADVVAEGSWDGVDPEPY